MNLKVLGAAVAGGIANWLLGALFYLLLLGSYFGANHGDGVMKDPVEMHYIILGCLFYGLLLAVIFDRWAGIKTLVTGAKAGAIIGLIAALAFNFWKLGDCYFFTSLVPALVDTVVQTIMAAGTGAVVGWVLGRGND